MPSLVLCPGAGLSNIITSLTGAGLTGSYIFSQTLFSMRAGVHTKLHGWIIAGAAAFWVPHQHRIAVKRHYIICAVAYVLRVNIMPGSRWWL